MVEVFGRKGTLKAAKTHSECHGIHIYKALPGFSLIQFFLICIDVSIDRHIVLNSCASPQADVLGECFESWVVGDMIIIYVYTLSDFVCKCLFLLKIAHPHERNHRDGHSDSGLLPQKLVLLSEGTDVVKEVAGRCVRQLWNYLKHPRPILVDNRERKIIVLL